MNQLYIYIYPHISSLLHLPPSHSPYPTPLGGHKEPSYLPVLCGCFLLAIYFTLGSVYLSMPLSYFILAYPSPSPCPQVHSLVGLRLYSCLAPRFFIAAHRLSLVAVNRGYSSLWCTGFSLRWLLLLWSTGSRRTGFSSCGSRALGCRLSSCGARA